jgi:LysM repeat protein
MTKNIYEYYDGYGDDLGAWYNPLTWFGGAGNKAIDQYVEKKDAAKLQQIYADADAKNAVTAQQKISNYAKTQKASTISEMRQLNSGKGTVYEVERGDSLSKIAAIAGISYQVLASLNGISPNSTLQPGQQLYLPFPQSSGNVSGNLPSSSGGGSYDASGNYVPPAQGTDWQSYLENPLVLAGGALALYLLLAPKKRGRK